MRVTQSRKAGLNISRTATGSCSEGTVAKKRLLNSIDSNCTRLRAARRSTRSSGLASSDSTLNGGSASARSGTCALASTARGSTVLENRPPSSRSSASHDAPQNPWASCPVSRLVPTARVQAADVVVSQVAPLGDLLRDLRPARGVELLAHQADPNEAVSSAGP